MLTSPYSIRAYICINPLQDTSEWTLDYPPLFAWFEWSLSHFAFLVDPLIVRLDSLYYDADSCLWFQRLSVMLSDVTLLFAVYQ